ncbi:MAG: hypothetical protein EHM70_17995 [Chloroflexota bacterium]|nr:MAG: hypothetical protein EHM70_17995 [Chloroflexota bacterium]
MSYLVVLVVNSIDQWPPVLDAWEKAGAPGVTILASTGLGRVRRAGLLEDMPLFPSLQDLFENDEVHNRTMLSVVEDQESVDRLVKATMQVTGNLDDPHSGFLFVVPVLQVYGMGKHRQDRSSE